MRLPTRSLSALTLSALALSALTISALSFAGCTGATGGTPASGQSSSSGDATWSATINGQPASGSSANRASFVSLDQDNNITGMAFQLGHNQQQKQGFDFVILKSGTTVLLADKIRTVCNYYTPEGLTYVDDSATATITSSGSQRASGIFSGRFKKVNYGTPPPGNFPETIEITNGKFDLPSNQ